MNWKWIWKWARRKWYDDTAPHGPHCFGKLAEDAERSGMKGTSILKEVAVPESEPAADDTQGTVCLMWETHCDPIHPSIYKM